MHTTKTFHRRLAMKDVTKLDFTGQPLYIGLDIHKKSWSVSIFSEQMEHKTYTQPPTVEALVKYLKRMFPGATYHAAYEAGFSGYWIHDGLQASDVQCRVVHPPDIPTKDKERLSKADRVDCRKLGRGLRGGQLQGIYIPPPKQREDRSLVRTRASMVRKQTRCKNQISSMLYFYGITISEQMQTRRWSRAFIGWLETIQLQQESGNRALRACLDELLHLRQIIAQLNHAILQLSRTEAYAAQVRLLKTVPGIGTLTAMILLTEIGDMARFAHLDKLASYAGLTPIPVAAVRPNTPPASPGGATHCCARC
jgi:transposase